MLCCGKLNVSIVRGFVYIQEFSRLNVLWVRNVIDRIISYSIFFTLMILLFYYFILLFFYSHRLFESSLHSFCNRKSSCIIAQ